MIKNLSVKLMAIFAISLIAGAMGIFAQGTVTGGIVGKVSDPQGAVLPNATVVVTNTGTNSSVTVTTNDDGVYKVTNLQPGTYRVEVTAGSFAPSKAENIIVEVGKITPLDVNMIVGTQSATVEVSAEAPVINTNDNTNSTNVNQTSINELPINGRRWSEFALLTPGTVPDGNFGLISFRGISGLLNNNTVDGGDNNQAFFSEERGRTRINYVISQAAIREFQVNTSNYSAEFGRSAGGVTNAVTFSGTNEFHGQAFYYNRNNANGARNPSSFQTVLVNGVPNQLALKAKDVRQQWGGRLCGPVVKNNLFFCFTYDQQKRDFPGVALFSNLNFLSLTAANRTTLNNKGISNTQIDSVLAFLLSETGVVPRKGDELLFLPKIDWNINDKNQFSVSYNRMRWKSPFGVQTAATVTRGRSNWGDDDVHVDSLTGRLQSTLSATMLNEFRFQVSRDFEFEFSNEPLDGEPTTALGGTRSPSVFIQNGLEFGNPTFLDRAKFPDERRVQLANTFTWSHGRHTFKFGGDINRVTDDISNLFQGGGVYSYTGTNALLDFVIDYIGWRDGLAASTTCAGTASRMVGRCYSGQFRQGVGLLGLKFHTWDYDLFVQDDFRVTPRLTLNLGLRYEYIKMPSPQFPNSSSLVIPWDGRTVAEATSNLPSDKNNFGPRFGFAYDITGDGKTSLRAGWGVYYGRIQSSTIYNALINTGNPNAQGQIQLNVGPTSPVFPNVLPPDAAATQTPAIQFFARGFQAPLIYQYDAVFERQILKNTVASVSYIGSIGRHLPTFFDLNNAPCSQVAVTCTNGDVATFTLSGGPFDGQSFSLTQYARIPGLTGQAMTRIQSTVKSRYDALVFQFNRRFTRGLQVQGSYTFAKSTDTNQNSSTFTETNSPYDILDSSFDKGPSNFDVRHNFVISAVWSPNFYKGSKTSIGNYLLNGWSISPIYHFYSGKPFSGTVSGTSLNRSFGASFLPIAGRNSFRLPNLIDFDLRLSKRFRLTESMNLERLAEAFNLPNRTMVFSVNNTLYQRSGNATLLTFNQSFGTGPGTSSTLYRERQVQFAARFQF